MPTRMTVWVSITTRFTRHVQSVRLALDEPAVRGIPAGQGGSSAGAQQTKDGNRAVHRGPAFPHALETWASEARLG